MFSTSCTVALFHVVGQPLRNLHGAGKSGSAPVHSHVFWLRTLLGNRSSPLWLPQEWVEREGGMLLFEMQDWFEKKGGLCVRWDSHLGTSYQVLVLAAPSLAGGLEEDPGVRQQWMREQITSSSCLWGAARRHLEPGFACCKRFGTLDPSSIIIPVVTGLADANQSEAFYFHSGSQVVL